MNEPRFTRGEYWLLETAVEAKIPLRCLASPDLAELLNKPPHGLSRDALLATLVRLVDEGLIRAMTEQRGEFAPTRSEIDAALDQRVAPASASTYYFLTAAGGSAWEAFAAPNWDAFIWHSMAGELDADGLEVHKIVGTSVERLRRYLEIVATEDRVDSATLRTEELRPFAPTYWKDLPLGYRLTFRAAEGPGWRVPSYDFRRWYRWE